jgi:hypothetical protein
MTRRGVAFRIVAARMSTPVIACSYCVQIGATPWNRERCLRRGFVKVVQKIRKCVRPKCFGGFAPTLCQGQPEGFGTSLIRGAHNCCLRFPEEQLANEPWPAGKIPVLQSPLGLLQRRKGQSTILAPRCLVWVLAKRDRRLQRSFEQKAVKVSKKICASGYNTTNKCRNGYHLRPLCSSVQLKSLALQLTLLNDAFARTIGG